MRVGDRRRVGTTGVESPRPAPREGVRTDDLSASILRLRPPARFLGADESRETDSGRLGEDTATVGALLVVHVLDDVAA